MNPRGPCVYSSTEFVELPSPKHTLVSDLCVEISTHQLKGHREIIEKLENTNETIGNHIYFC